MFTLLSSRVRSTGNRLLLSRISPSQQITSFYNSSRSAVNKAELKTIIANNSALLIDVRQPEELLHEGYIQAPQFVNVPLPEAHRCILKKNPYHKSKQNTVKSHQTKVDQE